MEQRRSAHLPAPAERSVVTPAVVYDYRLLPYEQDIIATLGISEQEYVWFVEEARRRTLKHGLGPVQATGLEIILINLAIGIALTAVSTLLAPRPEKPEEIRQRSLSDKQGRSRFNQAIGFDGAPSLAMLGSRVPILFGRFEPGNGAIAASGGLLAEPLMVWSRLFSHGSYQSIKALMVVGEVILDPPALEGLMIGGQPLEDFMASNYAVWWSSIVGENRIRKSQKIFGKLSGGPTKDVFVTATLDGEFEPGFAAAYSPSNNADFGAYKPIRNGGHWRVNWKVVSRPEQSGDSEGRVKEERRKIAGKTADGKDQGMPGIGRAYSVKMGLVKIDGREYSKPTEVQVAIGNRLTFRIQSGRLQDDSFTKQSGVTLDDVNNTSIAMREEADDMLQVGEIFLVNRTLRQVVERPVDVWRVGKTFNYKLEVIEFTGANNWIGLAGTGAIEKDILAEGPGDTDLPYFKGSNWYPLLKVAIAKFANTRKTEVTEVGIRSQCWAQAQGLANFSEIPSPYRLYKFDQDNIQLSGGQMSQYLTRVSFFVLGFRLANTDDDWDNLEVTFAIRGRSPVDQYNYIRIFHPTFEEYEFRILPKCATNFRWTGNPYVYVLSASGPLKMKQEKTAHGVVRMQFSGHRMLLEELSELKELRADHRQVDFVETGSWVTGLSRVRGTAPSNKGGLYQAFLEGILGGLKNSGAVFGTTRTAQFTITQPGDTITVEVKAHVEFMGEAWLAQWGTAKAWYNPTYTVVSSAGTFTQGDLLYHTVNCFNSHYAGREGYTSTTSEFRVDGVDGFWTGNEVVAGEKDDRIFETDGALKEVHAWSEIRNSCDDTPEHAIVYVNECRQTTTVADYFGLTMCGVMLRSMRQLQSFQQLQIWLANGINIERLTGGYGPSNNFADFVLYLLSNERAGLGQIINSKMIDRASFEHTARFLEVNHWTFDAALSDGVNIRQYLTQVAPLMLCNFVTKNGKFALTPALPVDTSGQIIQGPIPYAAMFTDSNIIEGSYNLSYIPNDERRNMKCVVKYRQAQRNALVEERTVMVRWDEANSSHYPQEDYDLTGFCTKRGQAFAVARYLLSLRRRVDHTIEFQTTPFGLSLAPGDFIRVETSMSTQGSSESTGIVRADGQLRTLTPVEDGTYKTLVYKVGATALEEIEMTVKGGKAVDPSLHNALFDIPTIQRRHNSYQVEEVALEEEGIVTIRASHHPVDQLDRSKIVADLFNPQWFGAVE